MKIRELLNAIEVTLQASSLLAKHITSRGAGGSLVAVQHTQKVEFFPSPNMKESENRDSFRSFLHKTNNDD